MNPGVDFISKYFPELTIEQYGQFDSLGELYKDWNAKINVISRKDIDQLYERHVLHSLAIAKWLNLTDGSTVLDVGCGGGFPGIPLAIYFPNVQYHLVDSVRKKLKVVNAISESVGLKNVSTSHSRVEDIRTTYDFVVSRAVANISLLLSWTKKNVSSVQRNAIPNGLICLKGGDLKEELKPLKKREYVEQVPVFDFFQEPFFQEKYIVYVQG